MKKSFKKITIIIIVVSLLVLIIMQFIEMLSFENNIIKFIDNNCESGSSCTFSMNEFTHFKWTKMILFQTGCTNTEIDDALGFKYKDTISPTTSGVIFVNNKQIIFMGTKNHDPKYPFSFKLRWYTSTNKLSLPKIRILTPENAIFEGKTSVIDGELTHEIAVSESK